MSVAEQDNRPVRVEVPLPKGFHPKQHGAALVRHIADKYGADYSIVSISKERMVAVVKRDVIDLTETTASESGVQLNLEAKFRKASAGDQVAAKFEEDMFEEGAARQFRLVEFEPHIGRALMMRMSDDEVRCRGAIADVIGCKPWDVRVQARRGGGFNFKLPRYSPSKHDDKLLEVAESVVGRFGWYVDVDAQRLTGAIIPSDPPTFPASVPFPASRVRPVTDFGPAGDKERFTLDLAEQLGESGKPNRPLTMSLEESNSVLIVGLPGSGKDLEHSTKLPVPLSERFPTGWARNDELVVGDLVYAADGTPTQIVGFSDWETKPVHTVHFSDGQSVRVSGTHLWKARNNIARVVNSGKDGARTTKVQLTIEKADALRAKAEEFVGTGAVGTLTDIAKVLGYHDNALYQVKERLRHLGTKAYVQADDIPALSWCMDDIIGYWTASKYMGRKRGTFGGHHLTDGDYESLRGKWFTGQEFVTHMVNVRGADESIARFDQHLTRVGRVAGARSKQVAGWRQMTMYPVDEAIITLAEEYEARAQTRLPLEQVVSTREMLDTLTYGKDSRLNWAVRVPGAIAGEHADLPIDPWLLGAWLGDGTSRCGSFTVGHEDAVWTSSAIGDVWADIRAIQNGSNWTITCAGLTTALKAAGVRGCKHIPAQYKRASVQQRLALLQGLMDTDGSINKQGACELALSDERLAADALELIRSLGIKASMSTNKAGYRNSDGEYIPCKDRHRIKFTTTIPVFRMPRKAERLPTSTRDTQNWNYVTDITVDEPTKMRCIKVDHPEHLFLVEGFIPTHNSVSVRSVVCQALIKGFRLAVVNTPAKAGDYAWAKPYVEDHWWGCSDVGTSVAEALTVATLVDEEGKRLGALLQEHRVNKWQDLPPEVKKANPPVLIVADELANLLSKPTIPAGLSKEAKALPQFVQMAQDFLEAKLLTLRLNAIVAVHRAAGIRELYLTQRPSKTEGFPPELKSLIPHRVLLGPSPSEADIGMAFRDARRIPRVPGNIASDSKASRGAGIVHLDGSDPAVVKGYFATDADFEALLRKHLGPGDPSDDRVRPTAAQVEKYVPRADGGDIDPEDAADDLVERAPSGKPAAQVAREMGDAMGMAMHDGSLGKGYERANNMRNLAAGGGPTRKDREAAKEEARNAARSSDVTTTQMAQCSDCGGWINPITGSCTGCG